MLLTCCQCSCSNSLQYTGGELKRVGTIVRLNPCGELLRSVQDRGLCRDSFVYANEWRRLVSPVSISGGTLRTLQELIRSYVNFSAARWTPSAKIIIVKSCVSVLRGLFFKSWPGLHVLQNCILGCAYYLVVAHILPTSACFVPNLTPTFMVWWDYRISIIVIHHPYGL